MSSNSNITLKTGFAGENNDVIPRLTRLYTPNNTLAEIAAAAFLDGYLNTSGLDLLPTDFVFAVASDGHQVYRPVFTSGSVQLTVLP